MIALLMCYSIHAYAETADKINSQSAPLTISIDGTRDVLSVGTSFGLSGTITNNSSSIIYLNEKYTTLKVPSEIEGPYGKADGMWYAFFPSADHGDNDEKTYSATIAIRPGEKTAVYWLIDPREMFSLKEEAERKKPDLSLAFNQIYKQVSTELNYLLFSPGSYKITIAVAYWSSGDLAGSPHLSAETKVVNVAAPISVILFGAGIGGLIAFAILPQARRGIVMAIETDNPYIQKLFGTTKLIFNLLGAILLSAIITILLSRISESQLLIRVTVSDLWGAIAIGFIANYLGTEVLNKVIGKYHNENNQTQ